MSGKSNSVSRGPTKYSVGREQWSVVGEERDSTCNDFIITTQSEWRENDNV